MFIQSTQYLTPIFLTTWTIASGESESLYIVTIATFLGFHRYPRRCLGRPFVMLLYNIIYIILDLVIILICRTSSYLGALCQWR